MSYTMLIPVRFVHQSDALYYAGIPRTRHIAVSEAHLNVRVEVYVCVCVGVCYVCTMCVQSKFSIDESKAGDLPPAGHTGNGQVNKTHYNVWLC